MSGEEPCLNWLLREVSGMKKRRKGVCVEGQTARGDLRDPVC